MWLKIGRRLMLWFIWLEHLVNSFDFKSLYFSTKFGNDILIGKAFKMGKYSDIQINQPCIGNIVIGDNVILRKYCSLLVEGGRLQIGSHTFFNSYSSITCLGEITIGEYSIFGEGVRLYDHNHKHGMPDTPIPDQGMSIGTINIGKHCWIGSHTIILNNVTIGDNVIIGANNLIFKSIPSNTIIKSKTEILSKNLSE